MKLSIRRINPVALLLPVITLYMTGCTVMQREIPEPNDPRYAPVAPLKLTQLEENNGAIYQSSRNFSLYGDRIALNVGDILTVVFDEETSSSKSTETSITKDAEISFNQAQLFGTDSSDFLNFRTDPNFERDFDGEAESDQSNRLDGHISVVVSEVLPNGILRVRGEKWLTLNQGDEYVRLTGLVRPDDISTENTVPSSKIADARIAYGGTGDLDDANRQGWGSRALNSEWWIF